MLNKPFHILFLLLCTYSAQAQLGCVSVGQVPESFTFESGKLAVDSIYEIPVQLHVVHFSDSTGADLEAIQAEFDSASYFYRNAGIEFVQCNPIHHIYNDFLVDLHGPDGEKALAGRHDETRVINIYFVREVYFNDVLLCGYAYLPPGLNRIFINSSCLGNGNTLAHELGHTFSLYHTHGESNDTRTEELVDGSNCGTTGDYLCDTPADPLLSPEVVNINCDYTGTEKDANGEPYQPDPTNIMAYSIGMCMNRFTDEQYWRIRRAIEYFSFNDLACTSSGKVNDQIISLYPNPFTDTQELVYSISSKSVVKIEIFDLVGRKIATVSTKSQEAGVIHHSIEYGHFGLEKGTYVLSITVGPKEPMVTKMIRIE